ncbi:MAG: cytochrome c1 [Gammaproteobacteria bacterium]|nr:cytochrome c1 [Gammaproteobacteria bacterium]MDH5653612.1 cytochrome c1 [Gammaproteobacteria bacterium]
MKKIIVAFLLSVITAPALAAGGGMHNLDVDIDLNNKASLQRGAKLFTNYCLSCHSAKAMRYNRMAEDLGMSEKQVLENLIFTADYSKKPHGEPTKIGSLMDVAMRTSDTKQWFGTKIPDLSVVSRARGADWLYTYLMTFYIDESRPYGVNNQRFPNVGMPHVMWELQGLKKAVYKTVKGHDGKEKKVIEKLEMVKPGKLTEAEYADAMRDLVAFMVYMGEPAQQTRKTVGLWVILFLMIFGVLSYALKKEFWKDIH